MSINIQQALSQSSASLRSNPNASDGFSLIEMMIALTLGLIVVAGLGQLYVAGRAANRIIENTSSLNDNGRFAAEFLARDLRLAGYFSCGGAKANIANAVNERTFWFKLQGIEGYEGGVDTLPDEFSSFPTPLVNTDVFIIRYADARDLVEVSSTGFDKYDHLFTFSERHPFATSDIAVLNDANCGQTSIFQITNAHNSDPDYDISFAEDDDVVPGNCNTLLAGSYDCSSDSTSSLDDHYTDPADNFENASIGRFVARTFFVANDDQINCPAAPPGCVALEGCPTLFVAGTDQADPVAVLRDVNNMQIEYGIDETIQVSDGRVVGSGDNTVDKYLTADAISDDLWLKVASMRISLSLLPRMQNCPPKPFTTTVALRNAGIVIGDW